MKAFTLLELLVVVAITAILAAILFPVFAQAKMAAKRTADLSNQRQIGMALQVYIDQSDGEAPLMWMPAIGQQLSWVEAIRPYGAVSILNRSPLDDSPLWTSATSPRRTSYAMNGWFDRLHFAYYLPSERLRTPMNTMSPAGCVFAMPLGIRREGTDFLITGDHFMPEYWGNPAKETDPSYAAMQWNPDKARPKTVIYDQGAGLANILFLDGHAKACRFDSLFQQAKGNATTRDWFDPLSSGE